MFDRTIYTRAFSKTSAGSFISAKGWKGDPLSDIALAQEFRNHADNWNWKPTALVSCSDRIVDTLTRAFGKHYMDGESPADIWIAFMEVPSTIDGNLARVHSAEELAEKCGLLDPGKFSHEVVFEWAIPENYVLHKVSLQTLMERGMPELYFLQPSTRQVRSTREVREYTAQKLQPHTAWETGITLGCFARKFGARAPLDWISHQLFHDCVWAKILTDDIVRLNYASGHPEIVDFQFFCGLDDGIETALYDWWLADIDFVLDWEEFREQQSEIEDSIAWDLIEFWETWHDVNHDGTIKERSAMEYLIYHEEKRKLLVKHKKKEAALEAEAVKIGL